MFFPVKLRLAALAAIALISGVVTAAERRVDTQTENRRPIAQAGSFPCSMSLRLADGTWQMREMSFRYPAYAIAADGATTTFAYRGYDDSQQLMAMADCIVPATRAAAAQLAQTFGALRTTSPNGRGLRSGANATALTTLEVTACGPGYTGEYPNCKKDSPTGTGGTVTPTNPASGGGGGGGTTSDPTQQEDPEQPPCESGNPILDSPTVEKGFQDLWSQSNATANLADRHEQIGWIVQGTNGYYIYQWPISGNWAGFCNGVGDVTAYYPPEGPGAIVGFVHTHPYALHENVLNCEGQIVEYLGHESDADRAASVQLGQILGRSEPLTGWIIDRDQITAFEGLWQPAGKWTRCGY
jgi:hypothetical protein